MIMSNSKSQPGRDHLTDEQYRVCWRKETEPPFSGALLHNRKTGEYHCVCCGSRLFDSSAKFDSGCGWPSFDQALPGAVRYQEDHSAGMRRTEILCQPCGAHLALVFDDGPTASGQRYCVNSVSLTFTPRDE